ncbi:PilZ domain-containing protein [Marinobacter daqiaonensis]|uniref:PilZ domain-containing protein n=1 Tax=Marinobacter daqiaonensis TaxID=650891 RepID=A0A1I6GKM8_9GAMM|nr:PilZ domain-containing protein [Marinobacter daqiaonensis]SFR42701.1 PilZ domain-containing protein [Marinobacter daqiaonensis]
MKKTERRGHIRTALNARVSVEHETLGKSIFSTRDISDGGIFVVVEDQQFTPDMGDLVTVQVQGLPIPAPELRMVVVRKTVDGFGLQFADHQDD